MNPSDVSPCVKRGLTNNQLKIIAMLAMLSDHVGLILFPDITALRAVGRLAFPIFAYMIAEGCRYTKNRLKYLAQIAGVAAVCQTVCAFFADGWHLNILITFSMSILVIYGIDGFIRKKNAATLTVMILVLAGVAFVECVAPVLWAEQGFHPDYGALGCLLPVLVYFAYGKAGRLFFTALILFLMAWGTGGVQWWAPASLPLLLLYNGQRGRGRMKYVFYLFYPLHLGVIYLISALW